MPKPPQTYLRGAQNTKIAMAAKNTKSNVAVANTKLVDDFLRHSPMAPRRLAEIKSLIEAMKKGTVEDKKKRALLDAIKEVIKMAEHAEKFAKAHAMLAGTLAAPAHAVIRAAPRAAGATPNFAPLVGPILLFLVAVSTWRNSIKSRK